MTSERRRVAPATRIPNVDRLTTPRFPVIGFALGISVAEQLSYANTARQANRLPRWFFGRQIAGINLVAFQQIMAAFAADTAFDQAVALRATLGSQGNFSLRAGADDHFNSFLEQFRLGPGSNERGKLAEAPFNLKRLATTLPGRFSTTRERVNVPISHSLARRAGMA